MTGDPDVHGLTTRNRRQLADLLDTLDDTQWAAPTLCAGWTVTHLAAHLVQPMLIGFARFALTAVRHRGDTDRTVDHLTRRLARRPRADLIALLRAHAADRLNPPRVGPMGPFADTCIHLRDIARPLGLDADVPLDHWRLLTTYLASPSAAPALVPPGRLAGLRLVATDTGWSGGTGAEVIGPAEAIAMAVTGRAVALADLHGPGVDILAGRLRRR
ncbi:maleylpyruvate isomerase family mycothiol-dependent enzyme [Spirilliplanes yamanashiensis]|uniref:Mycothiol-dependent maleylpyruvate isomerase metal-binding domain-containing protein n=1 Tax=Spirilliplanes yamanashiensis TaxID=42233 RepID=A0A8J4DLJ4_9ACTN|nr:maleylpyruvate isomerase family mycothiol-dependent enzyme [Spirilliplanes yamanashiensis]MDP9818689.1 uncharacterized protein (TIGR03083 family) [Spirilliplanes yamanashiensis]GIJ05145.1 hypothetical protein Sya03_44970 [Spirilliplanes yamanashiensis]